MIHLLIKNLLFGDSPGGLGTALRVSRLPGSDPWTIPHSFSCFRPGRVLCFLTFFDGATSDHNLPTCSTVQLGERHTLMCLACLLRKDLANVYPQTGLKPWPSQSLLPNELELQVGPWDPIKDFLSFQIPDYLCLLTKPLLPIKVFIIHETRPLVK
jgi:hypothetical protein